MRVPSLDDLCTTVVASVPESLADRDDETSVTDTALLRNVSGKDTASVNASPDLDLRFLPSTTYRMWEQNMSWISRHGNQEANDFGLSLTVSCTNLSV